MMYALLGSLATVAFLAQGVPAHDAASRKPRPYTQLFTIAPEPQTVPVVAAHQSGAVVEQRSGRQERGPCNMPIIVANTDIDPKIVRTIPRGAIEPKARVIGPSTCGNARAAEVIR